MLQSRTNLSQGVFLSGKFLTFLVKLAAEYGHPKNCTGGSLAGSL